MKEVYWKDNEGLLNVNDIDRKILLNIYNKHHNKNDQTFLCPECRKGKYTMVKLSVNDSIHFRHLNNHPHDPNCSVTPVNALPKILSHSSNIELIKNKDKIILDFNKFFWKESKILEIDKKEIQKISFYNSQSSGQDKGEQIKKHFKRKYNTFADIFNFYIVNLDKFADEGEVLKDYKGIQIKTPKGLMRIGDLFLSIDRAIRLFKSLIKNSNKELTNHKYFIYGRVQGVYPTKNKEGVRVFITPLDKSIESSLYLYIPTTNLADLVATYNALKIGRPIFFYGYPYSIQKANDDTKNNKIIVNCRANDGTQIGFTQEYLSESGHFVDSYNEKAITDYLFKRNIKFIKPAQREESWSNYNIARCKKEFNDETNSTFYIPDWIINDQRYPKPIIVELYGYEPECPWEVVRNCVQKKENKDKFYPTLPNYYYVKLDIATTEKPHYKNLKKELGRILKKIESQ